MQIMWHEYWLLISQSPDLVVKNLYRSTLIIPPNFVSTGTGTATGTPVPIPATTGKYRLLIGQYWSRDLKTGLLLVNIGLVTWIWKLDSYWSIKVTWPWLVNTSQVTLIGQYKSRDLNTGLWLVIAVDPSNGGRCGDVVATPLMENFAYCLDMCNRHSFTPSSQVNTGLW